MGPHQVSKLYAAKSTGNQARHEAGHGQSHRTTTVEENTECLAIRHTTGFTTSPDWKRRRLPLASVRTQTFHGGDTSLPEKKLASRSSEPFRSRKSAADALLEPCGKNRRQKSNKIWNSILAWTAVNSHLGVGRKLLDRKERRS